MNEVKIGKNLFPYIQKTLSYKYATYPAYSLGSDIQDACLKQPCFGEIRYGEKGQKHFLLVFKINPIFSEKM